MKTSRNWDQIVAQLDFAFQPIVNVHTGACYACEALLRGTQEAGFSSIHELFDAAYADLRLHWIDLQLRELAIKKFARISHHRQIRLFFNLDCRILEMPDYVRGRTNETLAKHGLSPTAMCFEISERHDIVSDNQVADVLKRYRDQGFKIALDDYGSGYSGPQLLHRVEPGYIKIDRFFIDGIESDARKRLFVISMIDTAHLLGISVVCEGVETLEELRVCREAGCDLVQGYVVQRPTTDIRALLSAYPVVLDALPDRRAGAESLAPVAERMEVLDTLRLDTDMSAALEKFRDSQDATFWVIVDDGGEPVGLLRERSIRPYVFSPFGWALLAGGEPEALEPYVTRCPIAEIHTPLERLAEMFAFGDHGEEGVIVTDHGRYAGFLSASQIIKCIYERDVALARDQNPLTGLPGNNRIGRYIQEALDDRLDGYGFVYFDFDQFKAFNDKNGFRAGDRAIQLFADILKRNSQTDEFFVGHIGGDDFFAGIKIPSDGFDALITRVWEIMEDFRLASLSLSNADEKPKRDGAFLGSHTRITSPGVGISAAVVHVPRGRSGVSPDGLTAVIATLKTSAKTSPTHIASLEYDGVTTDVFPDQRASAHDARATDQREDRPERRQHSGTVVADS